MQFTSNIQFNYFYLPVRPVESDSELIDLLNSLLSLENILEYSLPRERLKCSSMAGSHTSSTKKCVDIFVHS